MTAKPFSLTRRLIFSVVISQLLLAAALVIVGSYFARYYLQSAFDVNLEGRALSIAALVYFPDDHSPGLLFDSSKIPPSAHHTHKDIYIVKSDEVSFDKHSDNADQNLLSTIPVSSHYWNFTFDGEPYRAIVLRDVPVLDTEVAAPQPHPKLTVLYAAPTMDISQRIGALAASIGFTSLMLVIPSIVLAIWSIRRTLVPLNQLASQARSVSVNNWRFEAPEEAKAASELLPLVTAIETVLAGLQRAFTRQRDFLGDAAHELKTSLAILKSTWQSLLHKPRTAAEYREGLIRMSEDSERLEELLNRMLRLARVEQSTADGIDRNLDKIDLASTCEMAVARINRLAASRNVEVEFSGQTVIMRADPADLELVWLNLLENAIHYSSPGSRVDMLLTRETEFVTVMVNDTGIGIPESELSYIFERFRRGDPSRSRSTGGFGLGLAIAKSIVEAYKGSIFAESKVGVGTRISVIFPVDQALQIEADPGVYEGSRL